MVGKGPALLAAVTALWGLCDAARGGPARPDVPGTRRTAWVPSFSSHSKPAQQHHVHPQVSQVFPLQASLAESRAPYALFGGTWRCSAGYSGSHRPRQPGEHRWRHWRGIGRCGRRLQEGFSGERNPLCPLSPRVQELSVLCGLSFRLHPTHPSPLPTHTRVRPHARGCTISKWEV